MGEFGSPIQWVMAAIGAIGGYFFGDFVAKKLGYTSGLTYWLIKTGIIIGGAVIGWFAGTIIKQIAINFLLTNPNILLKMPLFVKWFLGIEDIVDDLLHNAVCNVIPNTINHIMQEKHSWGLLGKFNWDSVKDVILYVLDYGTYSINYAGNYIYTATYLNQTIVVTIRVVNGIIRLIDAYVKTR